MMDWLKRLWAKMIGPADPPGPQAVVPDPDDDPPDQPPPHYPTPGLGGPA